MPPSNLTVDKVKDIMYNDGMACKIYRPVAGTLNFLSGVGNTSMVNMLLSHTYPHNPRPGKDIVKLKEEDLDNVLNGYTRQSKGITNDDIVSVGKQRVLDHAKERNNNRSNGPTSNGRSDAKRI